MSWKEPIGKRLILQKMCCSSHWVWATEQTRVHLFWSSFSTSCCFHTRALWWHVHTSASINPCACVHDLWWMTFTCSYHSDRIDVLWTKHWVKVQYSILGQREVGYSRVRGTWEDDIGAKDESRGYRISRFREGYRWKEKNKYRIPKLMHSLEIINIKG